jgi:hypothetical protein
VGLIDANPVKQSNFLLDGKKISDSSILNKSTSDSVLIITAIAHTAQIQKKLQTAGYAGEMLTLEN